MSDDLTDDDSRFLEESPKRFRQWGRRMESEDTEIQEDQILLNTVGSRLRKERKKQSRSLEDVAEKMDVDFLFLCFLEVGTVERTEFIDNIDSWLEALGLNAENTHNDPLLSILFEELKNDE